MLGQLLKEFSDFGVIRRSIFFNNVVCKHVPDFVTKMCNFASRGQKRKRGFSEHESKKEECSALATLSSNLSTLFPETKKGEQELWTELHEHSLEQNEHALGAVLVSENTHCRLCSKPLYVNASRISEVVVYDERKGTFLASKIPKVCSNKKCQFTQHYGYYTVGNDKFFEDDWTNKEFLLSTAKTAFSIDLLKKLEIEILHAKMSFKEKAEIYNAVHGYTCNSPQADKTTTDVNGSSRKCLKKLLNDRVALDRRRLEEGLLLYWCLQRVVEYSLKPLNKLVVPAEIDDLIQEVSPLYHDAFIKKWIIHKCEIKGCESNMVLDGNFDNNRECCMAKESGSLIYDCLPGEIHSGCINTPKLGERFCKEHGHNHKELDKDVVQVNLEEASKEFGDTLGPVLRSAKKKLEGKHWGQVDHIVETKCLRNRKFYKVKWIGVDKEETWEPECNVPKTMVDAFERGEQGPSIYLQKVEKKFGITSLTNVKVEGSDDRGAKRMKLDEMQQNKGSFFEDTPHDRVDKCNTEKSKHYQRKNFRTAGTFFGMKPCGIILFVYELFISESKSQVYGILHDVFAKWGMPKIERICYDDACHLKKYCMNPKRKGLTEVTERLCNMDMVIDKMHFRNHVDSWCKANCNPYDRKELDGV